MMKSLLVITTLLAVAFAYDLNVMYRDFTPSTCTDFESATGSISGCVLAALDQDQKPVYGGCAVIHSQLTFAEWYRSVSGVNLQLPSSITLDLNNGVYSFEDDSFFPVDSIGFGNYASTGHNFHFTTEIDATANYNSGDYITITSSDACWVFVNGIMAGSTSSGTIQVNMDSLGLTVGHSVDIRVFQANRHTADSSSFSIATTMQLATNLATSNQNGRPASICQVTYPNFCAGYPQPVPDTTESGDQVPFKRDSSCPDDPAFHFGGVAYAFSGFNAISFGGFNAGTGDVEGRVAVRDNLAVGNGYSFGAQLRTGGAAAWDTSYPYSLVVGGDATWGSGAIYPDGAGSPNIEFPGPAENAFVGGSLSSSQNDLHSRVTGSCNGNAGCLEADFDAALEYYMELQSAFATVTDNVVATLESGLTLTCNDANADAYSVTIPGSSFAQNAFTYWTINNCNVNKSQLVINIEGSGDVYFQGGNIEQWSPDMILYNILGSGRVIRISGAEVDGSILAPQNSLYQTSLIRGIVIVGDIQMVDQINRLHCPAPAVPVHPTPSTIMCGFWEETCRGLDFPLGDSVFSFRDFGVISFGNFVANTGDIEARLAAAGDVTLGSGYSIGYKLQTFNNAPDNSLPYSAVIGGDLCWASGELFPSGTGIPFAGDEEYMFVGGSVCGSTSSNLADKVVAGCGQNNADCLQGYFDNAQSCYEQMSDDLAALSDNVASSVSMSCLIITCGDNTDTEYVVSIDSASMNSYTYITTDNCNMQANWVVNIRGTGDVNFNGDSFPAIPGGVVYNVIGDDRTVTVTGTSLSGSLLAPTSTLYQTGGVIVGKVVAGDVTMSLQINKMDCPNPPPVTVQVPVQSDTPLDSTSIPVPSIVLAANDQITLNGNQYTVIASSGSTIYIKPALMSSASAGDVITAQVDATQGRNAGGDVAPNSSSVITFSVALIAAILALFF